MNQSPKTDSLAAGDQPPAAPGGLKSPWFVFVVPFVVYLALTQLEPSPPDKPQDIAAVPAAATAPLGEASAALSGESTTAVPGRSTETPAPGAPPADAAALAKSTEKPAPKGWLGLEYRHYPLVYTLKIALTFAAMLLAWPGYREVPFRVTLLAPLVGAIGAPIWIGLCRLETNLLPALGLDWLGDTAARTGFNPLVQLADNPAWAYGFLAIRFFGLVVVVAVIEEFFLRGFLIRFLMRGDWWNVPLGTATPFALVAMTVAAALSHPPSEYLAAVVWFSLVSWLMIKTRSLWDCVVAHGVTNLLMGLYVVFSGSWELM